MMENLLEEIENIIEAEYSKAERSGSELDSHQVALKILKHLEYRDAYQHAKYMEGILNG